MKKIFLSIFLYSLVMQVSSETFIMTKGYESAYMEVLKLKFERARTYIRDEYNNDPSNIAYKYLESYSDFLKAVISEEEADYTNLLNNKSERIKSIELLTATNPWRLYSLAQINLQTSIVELKAGDYLKSAIDLNKAYKQFKENDLKFPAFIPNKAGMGLLHILIGSVPDSYSWITGSLGMEGNINKGRQEILKAMLTSFDDNKYPYIYQECLFLSAFVSLNLVSSDTDSGELIRIIKTERFKKDLRESPLLIYAISSYYIRRGMNEDALQLLTGRPLDNSYYPFYYLDYLTGVALLNKLDPKARFYFLRFVTNFKGKTYKKSAYQHLAWSYLIDNDNTSYLKYISRIPHFGSNTMENDKEASREFAKKSFPNKNLLKARLLFDGGYYKEAEQVLNNFNQNTLTGTEKIEYVYRKARIYHKSGDYQKARLHYLETYKLGKDSDSYYAANSLLNLGNIYELENKINDALWCYEECLRLNYEEFRTSISQKAKAGINRITKS
ncbi:MAG: tetratricopeptide repeat protein [Chloroflexota bacterium]